MNTTTKEQEFTLVAPGDEAAGYKSLENPPDEPAPRHMQAFTPEMLIAQAIEKQVPVETMERLLAMRRELKAERAKEQYNRAMAGFQGECPTIQKTKEVKTNSGKVAYRYAPIESIQEQTKHLIQKYGFSYAFT